MRRYIIILLIVLCGATTVGAQSLYSNRYYASGELMNRDVMMLSEMVNLSQSSFQYGTARSMAMGGALTSLGGDASSMMINPAGLGMYRGGEFSITPMLTVQRSKGEAMDSSAGSVPFALGNLSAVFNVMGRPSGKLLSLSVGVGVNRIADYNYSYSTTSTGVKSSIAYLFSEQLSAAEVDVDDLKSTSTINNPDWNTLDSNLWSAALGYKCGLTDGDGSAWSPTWLNPNATVDQRYSVDSEGSAWEFDISAGGNIDNKLYFGFTFGVQSIYQSLDLVYSESYSGNSAYGGESAYLNSSYYSQAIITNGAGVNAKFGVIYRPVASLRVGLSYHTPTYYSLDRSYQTSVGGVSTDGDEINAIAEDSQILEDKGYNRWHYRSSGKLLAGLSYTFGQRAILAVDYQLDRYGNTTMRSAPNGVPLDFYDASNIYQDQHTLKAGLEVKIMPQVALRAGGAWSSDLIRSGVSSEELYNMTTINRSIRGSFGVGVALSPMASIDITYMAQYSEYSDYSLFTGTTSDAQSGVYWLDLWQHNIALSLSFRI